MFATKVDRLLNFYSEILKSMNEAAREEKDHISGTFRPEFLMRCSNFQS
jgi:hypothetical protein